MARVLVVLTEKGYENYTAGALASLHNVDKEILVDSGANLTALWNAAVRAADDYDFVVISNNDVIFAQNWLKCLLKGIDGYDVAGPVSNAPGHSDVQNVRNYVDNYVANDSYAAIESVSGKLAGLKPLETDRLNGFCFMLRLASLKAQISGDFFDESISFNGAEDKFFREHKPRTCVVPEAFVFHYKSVSVPSNHFKSQIYRKSE